MSDGGGGIRAVMISSAHYEKLMGLKAKMRLPTGSFVLEKLIDAAITAAKEAEDKREEEGMGA